MNASPAVSDPQIEKRLERLARLQGTDPGLFVLAVHSFVEGFLRERCVTEDPTDDRFYAYLDAYREKLLRASGSRFIPSLNVLSLLGKSHDLTNEVRHRFAFLPIAAAQSATHHLTRFCSLAGIDGGEILTKVEQYLEAWKERRCTGELAKALSDTGFQLQMEKNQSKKLMERVAELEIATEQFEHLKEQRRILEKQIAEAESGKAAKNERIDELRAERARLTEELRTLKKRTVELEDAKAYLDTLSSMTLYTRTRLDYERMVTRLTQEQKKILAQISLDADFLIKGAAGTGKTLVLLKAIEKAKGFGTDASGRQDDLELGELSGSVALLTYTTTLVKYDTYLSSIMFRNRMGEGDRISTADSFLLDRLKALEPASGFDFNSTRIQELSAQYAPAGMDPKELAAEAENFIWANDITAEEYLEQMIERRGMKKPLQKSDRGAVWAAVEAMASEMEASRRYTRHYAAVKIARAAASGEAPAVLASVDYIFVDEAQDLSASVLKAIRCCARRCVVIAGDSDQSIYQPGFSFKRSGIDISGRSRILKTNFRNTLQIHDIAERYRKGVSGHDSENDPEAFREGPPVELFQAAARAPLADLLVERVRLFTRILGYDCENLCILVPLNDDILFLEERLKAAGYAVADIKGRDFDFSAPGAIRISTLHSSKGLDFPVVLPFLYRPPYFGSNYDEAAVDRMTRNLVYVALTRAMDHLNVFTLDTPSSKTIADVASLFGSVEK